MYLIPASEQTNPSFVLSPSSSSSSSPFLSRIGALVFSIFATSLFYRQPPTSASGLLLPSCLGLRPRPLSPLSLPARTLARLASVTLAPSRPPGPRHNTGYCATEELNIPCPLHTYYKMYASDSVLRSIAHTPPPRSIHQLRTGSVSVCMKHAFHMERLYDSNDLR